ncbi:MAG: HNH endonuclease [Salibacteraceae bacterium]
MKPFQYLLRKLRPNKKGGVTSPHKIALLLAITQLFEEGAIKENRIEFTPELVAMFQKMGERLSPEYSSRLLIHLPIYHLQSSGLWSLKTEGEIARALTSSHSPKSLMALMEYVQYGFLSSDFYAAMLNPAGRILVKETLIESYFPHARFRFQDVSSEVKEYVKQIEMDFLNGLASDQDEMVYETRSSLFKQQVPKLYSYRCAISGFKMSTTLSTSLLDACHIQPWSVNHLDTIQNGICLSPLLHRAFDRKLISISEDYRLIVSEDFMEIGNSPHSILQFKNNPLHLPSNEAYWPDQELLAEHRKGIRC